MMVDRITKRGFYLTKIPRCPGMLRAWVGVCPRRDAESDTWEAISSPPIGPSQSPSGIYFATTRIPEYILMKYGITVKSTDILLWVPFGESILDCTRKIIRKRRGIWVTRDLYQEYGDWGDEKRRRGIRFIRRTSANYYYFWWNKPEISTRRGMISFEPPDTKIYWTAHNGLGVRERQKKQNIIVCSRAFSAIGLPAMQGGRRALMFVPIGRPKVVISR